MEIYFNKIEKFIMKIQILDYPDIIKDKVEYFLQDGKRLRPILCLIFSGIEIDTSLDTSLDTNTNITYIIASSIEKIHCLSLVLDDLPVMDNDILRRGKQSFHSKYSVEYTNFFIYYMFNNIGLSLNILLDNLDTSLDTNNNIKYDIEIFNIINKLFTYNLNQLIDGQYDDCSLSRAKSSDTTNIETSEITKIKPSQFKDEIKIILQLLGHIDNLSDVCSDISYISNIISNLELNMKKTSSLFNLSICSGFLLQIWSKKLDINESEFKTAFEQLSIWSNILGYMFQISDDILDIDSDLEKGSPNICQILGKQESCKLLKKGCEWLKNMSSEIRNMCIIDFDIEKNIVFSLDIVNEIIGKILGRIG